MLHNRSRGKLIQTVIYLAHDTQALDRTALFRLLCQIDFEHFRHTGSSVTGMEYRAGKMGPVPFRLVQEWDHPEEDRTAALEIRPERAFDCERDRVVPRIPFGSSGFSKRELRIMKDVADPYRGARSRKMIDVTHAGDDWERVWANGAGSDHIIDYTLAIADDDPNREAILEAAAESKAIRSAQSR